MKQKDQLGNFRREVGERLREARNNSGETQATAAVKLGERLGEIIEPSRIGNYEQGTRLPDPLTMKLLCDIYSTWPSAIYGFPEAPTNSEEAKLLEKYRMTDDRGRRAIQGIAESQPAYVTSGKKSGAR